MGSTACDERVLRVVAMGGVLTTRGVVTPNGYKAPHAMAAPRPRTPAMLINGLRLHFRAAGRDGPDTLRDTGRARADVTRMADRSPAATADEGAPMKRQRLGPHALAYALLAVLLAAVAPLGPAQTARAADPCGTKPDDYPGATYRVIAPELILRITFLAGGTFEYELEDGVVRQGTYTATPQALTLVSEVTDHSIFRGCDGTSTRPGIIAFPGGLIARST